MKRFTMLLGLGLAVITLSWVLAPVVAEGIVPERINIQGILRNASGDTVADGSYSVIFTIYNDEFVGTVYWAETTSVTTTGGLFNHRMGAANPIPDTAIRLSTWLGIKVGADPEMTPRPRLVSVSHAYKVSTVQGASGGTISSSVGVAGDVLVGAAGQDDLLYLNGTDPNIALELRSGTFGGNPFIDFSNDAVSDYDARIQLLGDAGLKIDVPSTLAIPTGKVGIGTDAPGSAAGLTNTRLEIADQNGLNSDFSLRVSGGGATGSAAQNFAKSRGTLASPTVVQSGDWLGHILFIGYDGTDFASPAAWIRGVVDGAPGTDDMPGRLEFLTTPDGSATPTTQMTINNAGSVGIGTGTPSKKLDVAGSIKGDTVFSNILSSNSPLSLQAPAGTTRMYVDDVSGDVGIGTTTPGAKLDINGGKVLVQTSAGGATSISPGEYWKDNSILAWGNVGASGSADEFGVTSISHINTSGIYTVTINASASSSNSLVPIVQVMDFSGGGIVYIATVQVTAPNVFKVRIYDTGGSPRDSDFTFMVLGR